MIIALDGPSASGKGVIGQRIADRLNFAHLDTGLLFRAIAQQALIRSIGPENKEEIIDIAKDIHEYSLQNPDLRTEEVGKMASRLSVIAELRDILNQYQRQFGMNPPNNKMGAILDGRDIGTVIFPDADCKIFITAQVETRALRRHNQLLLSGQKSIFSDVLRDLTERDARDMQRVIAPLLPASDALQIDTTDLSIEHALEKIFSFIAHKRKHLINESVLEAL